MFGRHKKEEKKKHPILRLLGVFGLIFSLFETKKWTKYIKAQKREINELAQGDEDLKRFEKDSLILLKHLFIPSEENDNRPKILRPKSLASYVLIALAVKLTVTGFLFTTYPSEAELSAIVSANMINLANVSREEAGLEPLVENPVLAQYAKAKGQDMLDRDYFAHDTPEGKRPWEWIDRSDYDYVYAGENLAMDFVSAEVVHDAFLKSPSHRRNILNPKYREIGVAVLNGELDGRETTLLVKFYGTQRRDISTLATTQQAVDNSVLNAPDNSQDTNIAGAEIAEVQAEIQQAQNELAQQVSNQGLIIVTTSQKNSKAVVDLVIEYSNIFFLAFLLFIAMSLVLNIFINIKVQHSSVILQSVVVIALMLAMALVKFHFIEGVAPQLLIL